MADKLRPMFKNAALFAFMLPFALMPALAFAAGAEAKDVARLNNCTPKKVDVFQQKVGADASTIYKVECNAPKVVDDKAPQMANAVLVQCNGGLCNLLRPLYSSAN